MKSHEIVRAGAGAGKTYTLTHKVMAIAAQHLAANGRFPRLIVTTFTRKATQELRERLMLLALESHPDLVGFVNSRSHLVVSTIHGVMDLYLKRYGSNICVDPGYRVIGSREAEKLARQTLRQVLLGGETPNGLLESFPFNLLCTLVRRIDSILAEEPNAAPFSLEDFERLSLERASEISSSLREAAARIREESTNPKWIEMAGEYLELARILEAWPASRRSFSDRLGSVKSAQYRSASPPCTEETNELAKSVRKEAKTLLEPLHDPEAWRQFSERYKVIDEIAKDFSTRFRKAKLGQGWLEIGDLEHRAMECIRAHPQSVEAFAKEWDHWLIDEYQDTSPFQVHLLKALSGESPSFLVGDPQQSIYLFRGARSEVFSEREQLIMSQGGRRSLLSVNRRSRPELLLFLNDFFVRPGSRFQPMEPFISEGEKPDPKRIVARIFIAQEPDPETKAESGDEESIETPGGADADSESKVQSDQELRAIVRHIQRLLREGVNPDQICVLGRTNGTLIEIAEWLARFQLPTHVHAAAGFYDRREIRDALALFKFLVNPHDDFNLLELLRSPWFRLPDQALAPLAHHNRDQKDSQKNASLWMRLTNESSMSDELRAIRRLQVLVQDTLQNGLTEGFRKALIDSGLIDLSHTHDVSGRRESNLWKLLSRLQSEECRPGFNPLSFIDTARTDLNVSDANAEGDAVAAIEPDRINLMTVHASKGLEFKHVILSRMEQKPRLTNSESFTFDEGRGRWAMRIPFGSDGQPTESLPEANWLKRFRTQELEEHARVLYVALTRASESVFLSWTGVPKRDSWASLVPFDLSDGTHQTSSYSYLVDRSDADPESAAIVMQNSIEPRQPWRSQGGASEKATSVTEILDRKPGVHLEARTQAQITHLLQSASKGTAVHKLMELLKYPASDRIAKLVAKWFPEQEERVLAAVDFVRECTSPALLEIIQNGHVEWGFGIIESGLLIEGQIDLWGRTNSGEAWVIDYKSGSSELRTKAFDQLGVYALALRKSGLLNPTEPLRLAAVYPFSKEIFATPEPTAEQVRHKLGLRQSSS